MKITALETIRLTERPSLVWVQVHTDEGVTGLGESWFGAEILEADIHGRIAALVLGENPANIEALNRKMRPYAGYCGSSAEIRALSAVDVALWDIAGKVSGLPICDLLGGRCREEIMVYNTCAGPGYVSQSSDVRLGNFGLQSGDSKKPAANNSGASPESGLQSAIPAPGTEFQDLHAFLECADDLATSLLEMGIESMKIWPFDFAGSAHDGLTLTATEMKTALNPFEKIRNAHGDRIRIKAELHGLWTLPAAKSICKELEAYDVDWVEDPIWMDRTAQLPLLAQATRLPIAGGETLGGLGQMQDLIAAGGIDHPIVDVTWGGGITFAKKAAALAESRALPIAFHDCSGPITLTASTHLALNCPNVREQEITRGFYYGWYHECVDEVPPVVDGKITVSGRPGLGLSLQPDIADRAGAVVRRSEL